MNVGKCLIFPVTGRHVGENWARIAIVFVRERAVLEAISRVLEEKLQ